MASLQEMSRTTEESARSQKNAFDKFNETLKTMFEIPGILGPNEGDLSKGLPEFVKATYEFRSESLTNLETALKVENAKTEKICAELKDEIMSFFRI